MTTYPTNILVLDKTTGQQKAEEKSTEQQTLYSVNIPANTLTQGSKLRITSTIAKGGGVTPTLSNFSGGKVFCSNSNSQAILGVTRPGEIFDGAAYLDVTNEDETIHLTSSIEGNKIAGVCYNRICCAVFENETARQVYLSDPAAFIANYPNPPYNIYDMNGVFNAVPGGEYGPWCTYIESWFKVENIIEGKPIYGLMAYIRPGSTINNMTGYGLIYDTKAQKISIRFWKNQSMISYEGWKLFEADYVLVEGQYLYFVIDASYFSFDPVWLADLGSTRYPYIYFYVDDFNGNVIFEKIWSPRLADGTLSWYGTTSFSFNKPFDQILGPELDMYAGLCVLGENGSGACMSKIELSQYNQICGLCYAAGGLNYQGTNARWTMVDWSCLDRTWF